ncbi:ATP-binding protein [Methanobrevibacter curvatus]|uniref:Putative AAA-ATPase n=1 Tax=Methanobrevibacter curvatus TaxID=49547 RepID=A0A166B2V1_9EURY|nr:ATP-binding protein [Methanobrevibacter curvatus]KZX12799.1 putative AAA-ATPase [Methanobrevibacter curvatus]
MQKLPIGIQTFSKIREKNYLYVDKTEDISNLIENGEIYFLSRPRRFGKSLLVSTLKELFSGNKDLFEGLYIYNKWNWDKKYPVIILDFGKLSYKNPELLESSLNKFIDRLARKYSISLISTELPDKFGELIEEIYESLKQEIVILIDEYDKPIIDNITNLEIAEDNRKILNRFYQVLKASDEFLKFVFITGISKFSSTSIFSGLNNPIDLTLNNNYSTICGYSHTELELYFKEHIKRLGEKESLNYKETLNKIELWYDGYSWDGKNKVYNPFSTLQLFFKREFSNYWFKSGTPTFLMELLKKENNLKPIIEPILATENDLDTFEIENIDPTTLLFQTGYLTIKEKNLKYGDIEYILDIPNYEVRDSLISRIVMAYTNLSDGHLKKLKNKIYISILNKDSKGFLEVLENIYHRLSYPIKGDDEKYYHGIFLVALYLLGIDSQGEVTTYSGRADTIFKIKDKTIITEIKYSSTKSTKTIIKEAFKQIKEKKYYTRYKDENPTYLALAFSKDDIDCEFKERLE